jgi:hypothetical protein
MAAADQSKAQVKPRLPTRIAADARFILETPFIAAQEHS